MTTPGSETETDPCQESYLCAGQIDRRLVNKLKDEYFALGKEDFLHRSAALRYTVSETLSQYFGKAMRKQKNDRGVSIHRKWPSPLPDV